MDKEEEQINWPGNERKIKNSKLIKKLLLTVNMADLKWFTPKGKSVTYTEVFVEIDNWKNHR